MCILCVMRAIVYKCESKLGLLLEGHAKGNNRIITTYLMLIKVKEKAENIVFKQALTLCCNLVGFFTIKPIFQCSIFSINYVFFQKSKWKHWFWWLQNQDFWKNLMSYSDSLDHFLLKNMYHFITIGVLLKQIYDQPCCEHQNHNVTWNAASLKHNAYRCAREVTL